VELTCRGFVKRFILSIDQQTCLSGSSVALIRRANQRPLHALIILMLLGQSQSELTHVRVYLALLLHAFD
jgi:hypothetical protein